MRRDDRKSHSAALDRDMELLVFGDRGTPVIVFPRSMGRERNLGFRRYMPNLIQENKWRAMRGGMDASLIDFGKEIEVPMRDLAEELLEFVDDVLDPLGSRAEVEYLRVIARDGTSADRQVRVHQRTGHLHAAIDAR